MSSRSVSSRWRRNGFTPFELSHLSLDNARQRETQKKKKKRKRKREKKKKRERKRTKETKGENVMLDTCNRSCMKTSALDLFHLAPEARITWHQLLCCGCWGTTTGAGGGSTSRAPTFIGCGRSRSRRVVLNAQAGVGQRQHAFGNILVLFVAVTKPSCSVINDPSAVNVKAE